MSVNVKTSSVIFHDFRRSSNNCVDKYLHLLVFQLKEDKTLLGYFHVAKNYGGESEKKFMAQAQNAKIALKLKRECTRCE